MEQKQTYLIKVQAKELLPGISEKLEILLIDKDVYTKQFYRDIIKNGFEFVFIENSYNTNTFGVSFYGYIRNSFLRTIYPIGIITEDIATIEKMVKTDLPSLFKMDDVLEWKDGIKGFQKTILKELEYTISNNK